MRIVVSGTHASGKSTLISDFSLRHPEFTVLPDPFLLIDEAWDVPDAAMLAAQLRVAAGRLLDHSGDEHLIAERGPLDFLAYLLAIQETSRDGVDETLLEWATATTIDALRRIDLLVVLPLSARDPIRVGPDELPTLRATVNDILLELVDDTDIVSDQLAVAEITGDAPSRLAALEAAAGMRER